MTVREHRTFFLFFFSSLFIVLATGLITFTLERVTERYLGSVHPIGLSVLALLVLGLPLYFSSRLAVTKVGRILGSSVTMTPIEAEEPRKYLLMGYAPLSGTFNPKEAIADSKRISLDVAVLPSVEYTAEMKKCGLAELKGAGPWQQNLRAAAAHCPGLELICVLNPDQDQFDDFAKFLNYYLPDVAISQISMPNDPARPYRRLGDNFEYANPTYEDYSYVYEGLRHGLDMVAEHADADLDDIQDDICIDATPGFKPFSIAAAILTLNRSLKFSYVTSGTGPDGGRVRFYDAGITMTG